MASRPEFSPARCSATVLSWVSKLGALGQCLPVAPCTPETSDLVRTTNWPLDEGKSKRVGGPRPNEETMLLSTPSSHPLCQLSPNSPTSSNPSLMLNTLLGAKIHAATTRHSEDKLLPARSRPSVPSLLQPAPASARVTDDKHSPMPLQPSRTQTPATPSWSTSASSVPSLSTEPATCYSGKACNTPGKAHDTTFSRDGKISAKS